MGVRSVRALWAANLGLARSAAAAPGPRPRLLPGSPGNPGTAGSPGNAARARRGHHKRQALAQAQAATFVPGSRVPMHYYPDDDPENLGNLQHLDGPGTTLVGNGRPRNPRRRRNRHHHGPRGPHSPPHSPPHATRDSTPNYPRNPLLPPREPAYGDYELPECPGDRTVLAPKGQDYVLMAQITASEGTPLDVVEGPRSGDPVMEGPHPVVGRLVGPLLMGPRRRSRLCRLTYNVLVRRCPAPPNASAPGQLGLTVAPRCTAGSAWGSRCHYHCPGRHLTLRGRPWLECGEDLQWLGKAPTCIARNSCPVPAAPEHGLLSCRAQESADHNDVQTLAEGSECSVTCKPPRRLRPQAHPGGSPAPQGDSQGRAPHNATMSCRHGRWDRTDWACVLIDDDLDGDIHAVLADSTGQENDSDDSANEIKVNSLSDPCEPNPCKSRGTCLRGPPHQPVLCMCRAGYEGDRCERTRCKAPCRNDGRCLLVRGKPTCYCRTGFAGNLCQAPVRRVAHSKGEHRGDAP